MLGQRPVFVECCVAQDFGTGYGDTFDQTLIEEGLVAVVWRGTEVVDFLIG